jgi:hypothetical protein
MTRSRNELLLTDRPSSLLPRVQARHRNALWQAGTHMRREGEYMGLRALVLAGTPSFVGTAQHATVAVGGPCKMGCSPLVAWLGDGAAGGPAVGRAGLLSDETTDGSAGGSEPRRLSCVRGGAVGRERGRKLSARTTALGTAAGDGSGKTAARHAPLSARAQPHTRATAAAVSTEFCGAAGR